MHKPLVAGLPEEFVGHTEEVSQVRINSRVSEQPSLRAILSEGVMLFPHDIESVVIRTLTVTRVSRRRA